MELTQHPADAIKALQDAVVRAMVDTREYVTRDQGRLADIYSGRSRGGVLVFEPPRDGIEASQWVHELRSGSYTFGTTTANLLTSRLIQVFVNSAPGRPQFNITPRTAGAAKVAETQEALTDILVSGARLEEAVRRAAWLDPVQNYVGVRLFYNEQARDATERAVFKVIEAEFCGEEPFSRRFCWHARIEQWASLHESIRVAVGKAARARGASNFEEPQPWEGVAFTEVFDTAFALEDGDRTRKDCRVHVFVNPTGQFRKDRRTKKPDLGHYVGTYTERACPLVIEANMEPAANEDVAPAEAAQWLGLLDAISDTTEQIRREIQAANNHTLYDSDAIAQEVMQKVMNLPAGTQAYIPVRVGNDSRGISHTMRPVERNSLLGELITALQTYLALLDDVTGVGPQDRGISVNPSKSATEAATLSASSTRRTQARLATQDRRWSRLLGVLFEFQREFWGKTVEVPIEGVVRTFNVPDPKTARFAFAVGLDEMQNLSRRGRLDSLMMGHTVLTRHAATFPQGEPLVVAESLRRLLKALGWVDAAAYTTEVRPAGSPADRYTKALESGKDIPVHENDQHTAFIAYYGAKMTEAVAEGQDGIPLIVLQNAIQKHQVYLRQKESMQVQDAGNPSTVPGLSPQGDPDNQMVAQINAGLPPEMTNQMLGGV